MISAVQTLDENKVVSGQAIDFQPPVKSKVEISREISSGKA